MARPSVLVTSGIVLTRDTGMEGDISSRVVGLVMLVIVWPGLLQEVAGSVGWGVQNVGVCIRASAVNIACQNRLLAIHASLLLTAQNSSA